MGEEAYNAAMVTYYEIGLFFKAVAEELGLEKAMQLHEKSYDMYGETWESMLREQFPDGVDIKQFSQDLRDGLTSQGFTSEVLLKDKDTILIKNTKCPRYNGMKMAGLSDEVIEMHCKRGAAVIEKNLQKLEPSFRYYVDNWDAPNGLCDEVNSIKK